MPGPEFEPGRGCPGDFKRLDGLGTGTPTEEGAHAMAAKTREATRSMVQTATEP
jgi:hypothetical protein